MSEKEIGLVRHYFSDRLVAVLELTEDDLCVGDLIHIHGYADDVTQEVVVLRVEGKLVQQAAVGQRVEIEVADHVRVHDVVTCLREAPLVARSQRSRPAEALV